MQRLVSIIFLFLYFCFFCNLKCSIDQENKKHICGLNCPILNTNWFSTNQHTGGCQLVIIIRQHYLNDTLLGKHNRKVCIKTGQIRNRWMLQILSMDTNFKCDTLILVHIGIMQKIWIQLLSRARLVLQALIILSCNIIRNLQMGNIPRPCNL